MFIAAQACPRWFGRVFAFPPDPWRWKVKGRTVKDSEGEHSEGERRRVGVAVHIVQRNKLWGHGGNSGWAQDSSVKSLVQGGAVEDLSR